MIAAARIIIGRWWPHLLALAVVLAIGVTIVGQALHIDKLQADLALSKAQTVAAVEAAKLSEGLRGQEQSQDQASFAAQDTRCMDRINTARDAADAIGEIVNGSVARTEAGGTDVRPIVGADQLRRIIGQGAIGAAAGVSVGSNGAKP